MPWLLVCYGNVMRLRHKHWLLMWDGNAGQAIAQDAQEEALLPAQP